MIIFQDLHLVPAYAKTHASLMSITFLIIFPLGAWVVHLVQSSKRVWLHASIQLVGWVMMLAGLAIGTRMGQIIGRSGKTPNVDCVQLHNNAHTIVGTVVVVMMIIQPFLGLLHHLRFRRVQKRTTWTYIHIWYGRALILLGMINGGLGLQLAGNTTGGKIVYSVIAGISGAAFLGLIVWSEFGKVKSSAEKTSDIPMTRQVGDNSISNGAE